MKQNIARLALKGLMAVSVLTLAMGSSLTMAAAVTSWSYSTDTNFSVNPVDTVWNGVGGSPSVNVNGNELSWGAAGGNFQIDTGNANSNRSALTLGGILPTLGGAPNGQISGGPVTGAVSTNGGFSLGTSFTHWNNPISSSFATLDSGLIIDTLTLTPTSPGQYVGGLPVAAPTLNFAFKFQETPNGGSGGVCANGSAVPATGCPDIIAFTLPSTNLAFQYFDSLAGYNRTYFADIGVVDQFGNPTSPIGLLTDGECSAVGFGSGCFGFITPEAAHTSFQFAFRVRGGDRTVPEPASLALVGFALAGLGLIRRRKNAA